MRCFVAVSKICCAQAETPVMSASAQTKPAHRLFIGPPHFDAGSFSSFSPTSDHGFRISLWLRTTKIKTFAYEHTENRISLQPPPPRDAAPVHGLRVRRADI